MNEDAVRRHIEAAIEALRLVTIIDGAGSSENRRLVVTAWNALDDALAALDSEKP